MSLYHRTTPNARHNGTNRNNNNDNKKALAVGSLCCCATVLVVVLTAALLNGLLYSAAVRRRVLGSERVFPFLAPQALPQPSPPPGMDLAHPPPGSIYLGASVDWDAGDTPAAFNRRMGLPVTVFQHFMNVTSSLNGTEVTDLQYIVGAVRAAGSRWLALTMMPAAGLDAITDRGVDQIGRVCAAINSAAGVRVLLRWAHEMNGNWYQYGQVPRRYIDMWKRVTLSVRRYTNQTAMVWGTCRGGNQATHRRYWPHRTSLQPSIRIVTVRSTRLTIRTRRTGRAMHLSTGLASPASSLGPPAANSTTMRSRPRPLLPIRSSTGFRVTMQPRGAFSRWRWHTASRWPSWRRPLPTIRLL
ncbi:hypothetical protein BC828DRAFT_380600 [Blastocladiella britannica]|nr:hypothetical protein BC828DRAFT_380600 [Blastocladiella britannica]